MDSRVINLAARVVAASTRARPADGVLRQTLRAERGISAQEAFHVSDAVFTYYRWWGWLMGERKIEDGLHRALELAGRFRESPRDFSEGELRANAVPGWVAEELEVSEAWLRSLQREPSLWLRARAGQEKSLARKLGQATTTGLPGSVLYEGPKDLFQTPEFRSGEFEIQDIASQVVGHLCHPGSGERWWDACAGEGGKTMHLSDLMENKGLIWASDRAAWRLDRLKRRAARARVFNYRAAIWDGGPKLPTKARFDGVLVDAPCSGIGTWQRNPHARWTVTPGDVKDLAVVQKRLLAQVAPSVESGGKLIYSVCTLTRAETEEVVESFEKAQVEFEPWPLPHVTLPDNNSRALPRAPSVTIWPQQSGGGGMFVAAWRRTPKVS